MVKKIDFPRREGLDEVVEGCTSWRVSYGDEGSTLVEVWAPNICTSVIRGICWSSVVWEISEGYNPASSELIVSSSSPVNLMRRSESDCECTSYRVCEVALTLGGYRNQP